MAVVFRERRVPCPAPVPEARRAIVDHGEFRARETEVIEGVPLYLLRHRNGVVDRQPGPRDGENHVLNRVV